MSEGTPLPIKQLNPQKNKSYVFDKNRVLPTTVKQTTIDNNRTGVVTNNVNKRKVYNDRYQAWKLVSVQYHSIKMP